MLFEMFFVHFYILSLYAALAFARLIEIGNNEEMNVLRLKMLIKFDNITYLLVKLLLSEQTALACFLVMLRSPLVDRM